ncbi:MAG: bifunctional pyr operon transcriptional regulator/uracil phosphoribosyltransferase PyrR [Actinomycetaceae bacterium]|nr:bifunctional pyr operon transcriptional regulator/uracil phosphoribosyltransferase PyrR [Actinomycetaceae bacterium]
MTPQKTVLNEDQIARAIARISYEIIERTDGGSNIVVLGIPTRGVPLAGRIAAKISEITGASIEAGSVDITMYRDDLAEQPIRTPHPTRIPGGGIDGKTVIVVDDVLYTGRTVKAAMDALFDIGRPSAVRLAVLVDRGHRELPIRPDFVGKNLPTSRSESVDITLSEVDDTDAVIIRENA